MNQDRMFAAHPFAGFALNAAEISYVAAAVGFAVGVDDLAIKAGLGNAQPVVVTHHRGRVHNEHDNVAVSRFPQERNDAVIGVVKIDPVESVVSVIQLPERGLVFVSVIQMLNQPAKSVVARQLQQFPVELGVVVPFVATGRIRRP